MMCRVSRIEVFDVRFPTSLDAYGSDAVHTDPDYSCAYVIISTDNNLQGHGLTFTVGRGTEIVVAAVKALIPIVKGVSLESIFSNFGQFWRKLTSDSQLRWVSIKAWSCVATVGFFLEKNLVYNCWFWPPYDLILSFEKVHILNVTFGKELRTLRPNQYTGTTATVALVLGGMLAFTSPKSHCDVTQVGPEKGVTHLATAAVVNALWDLWGKLEGKPVWKLLADMDPEDIVSLIDFRYLSDMLTKEEAIEILQKKRSTRAQRERELTTNGYPAYTTACGWIGYGDEKIKKLCRDAQSEGFTSFKVKVGQNLLDDKRRLQLVRCTIGDKCKLMVDANQSWDVKEAIYWMEELSDYRIHWIEEPTSPDDILGHAAISKALAPLGIGVATGEQCHNRVMFKQFLQAGALQFCQIDSCRLGGVNENLAVILMAGKCK
ncbi:unnamed protein product, partial [Ixodes hexagonus]